MTLRIDRTHTHGLSNIDFRTQRDSESLKIFQPWTTAQGFGTMGNANYTRPRKEKNITMEVTKTINKHKQIANGFPDPKTYKTAQFYSTNKINPNIKNILGNERIAQLDENYKGKEIFTGDSMMIGDINKQRKAKKPKRHLHDEQERLKKQFIQTMIIQDKSIKNKEAIQETQLVKLNVEETLLNKVNIAKLKEIRLALRRRYANRIQFRKIFKQWDKSNCGEISVFDAHSMINNLSIPININETRVLIASSNTRGNETLNIEEFMHLIFSDNEALNVDLSKLKVKDEKFYDEKASNELKKKMLDNIANMSKGDEMNMLKSAIRIRLSTFIKKIMEGNENGGYCTFDKFQKVIMQFPIIKQCTKDPVLRALFDLYKNEDNLMDCKRMCDNLIENTNHEPFSTLKDLLLETSQAKITNDTNYLKELKVNNSEVAKRKDLSCHDRQIAEKARIQKLIEEKEKMNENEVNNTIPSTDFVKKIFEKSQEAFNKINQIQKTYSAHPSLLKKSKPQTRYGANPTFRDTSEIIKLPFNSPGYMDEESRFQVRGEHLLDFVNDEKIRRQEISSAKIQRIKSLNQMQQDMNYQRNYLLNEKEKYSELQKTKMHYFYETTIKKQNEFIE